MRGLSSAEKTHPHRACKGSGAIARRPVPGYPAAGAVAARSRKLRTKASQPATGTSWRDGARKAHNRRRSRQGIRRAYLSSVGGGTREGGRRDDQDAERIGDDGTISSGARGASPKAVCLFIERTVTGPRPTGLG
jgi:hypothetical protein